DGQLRRLDSELRYEDGHEYEYRGYHNVLFSVDELDDDVTSELAIVRQRALGGRAVPGSGASMAAEERAAARRSRANARIGALGRSARSFPIVKRTRHLTRGAARRLRDQLASRAVRPGSQ
ncbi:MAG: hypothetical protein CL424_18890, partial [Acidimicrobiaceae bacterium]|nr:hypothetical protein [Acidimicrobiaceae bacterium]